MPVKVPKYKAPFLLFHPHLETIYPAILRNVGFGQFIRERILTPDDDFLDLDWIKNGNSKVIILCHGLEGNSRRPYMKGMAKAFSLQGYDVLAWNYRSCGGEMNYRARFYHSGATDDLDTMLNHVVKTGVYQKIGLVGFSLGGNLLLKYLGEEWESRRHINAAIAISVPLDLSGSAGEIIKSVNWIYNNRFLVSLRKKVKQKSTIYPERVDAEKLKKVVNLRDFDEHFTAPLHGFRDAEDYYQTCSSLYFLPAIEVPTLILNAKNDTFLSPSCYPEELLKHNKYIELQITQRGGHVGFSSETGMGIFWSEQTSLSFMLEKMKL